jgi:glutamate formiminotransferase
VVDVVPFVPLDTRDLGAALRARDAFASWAAVEHDLPCFLYGPERALPEIRRRAFVDLAPDTGRRIAAGLRGPNVRALALRLGERVQVSTNLLEPLIVGPDAVYDAVAAVTPISGAELVGLAPRAVLDAIPPSRWSTLDLSAERTIEARAAARQ